MEDKTIAERNGASNEMLMIYQDKIDDLMREKNNANRLQNQFYDSVLQRDPDATVEDESSIGMND